MKNKININNKKIKIMKKIILLFMLALVVELHAQYQSIFGDSTTYWTVGDIG
jgi:hypothetical protein